MKKNTKILCLNGLFGMMFIGFCGICLFAGFVVFPGLVAKHLWNLAAENFGFLPAINVFQGILLWFIVALFVYLAKGGSPILSIQKAVELDDAEVNALMERIKKQQKAKELAMKSSEENNQTSATGIKFNSVDEKKDKENL